MIGRGTGGRRRGRTVGIGLLLGLGILLLGREKALAQGTEWDLQVTGWTEDGRYCVCSALVSGRQKAWVVINAMTSQQQAYPLDDPARLKSYQDWRDSHPTREAKPARSLPGTGAQVVISASGAPGSWKEDVYRVDGFSPGDAADGRLPKELLARKTTVLQCAVKVGRKTWSSARFSFDNALLDHELTVHWSPDGRRLAWVLHEQVWNERRTAKVIIRPTGSERIEIVGDRGVPQSTLEAVALALDKQGFIPVATGPAQDARQRTVIYAAKGAEMLADMLVPAVPGGASVEPLTWQPGFEIVVAVGASAAKIAPPAP